MTESRKKYVVVGSITYDCETSCPEFSLDFYISVAILLHN